MTKTIAIVALSLALVASHAWWALAALDQGVTLTHQGDELRRTQEALVQALAVIEAAGAPEASRDRVIAAARAAVPDRAGEPFEKEGFLWVGSLGLRFSDSGRLEKAEPAWSPFP